MKSKAELLSPATNYAVVQLPGRKFPGVVVQGDSLNNMIAGLEGALAAIAARDFDEAVSELSYHLETLLEARNRYERICREKGIFLPYS